MGGAELGPGQRRALHGVSWARGTEGAASELLGRWASGIGRAAGARVAAPFQVGWCSWYHYFDQVTEADLRRNLAVADRWPFDVFQLDDGYQAAIGDWLDTNAKFPSRLESLAADVAARGRRPGIWLAPFLAAPDSELVRRHPDWVARYAGSNGDEPLRSWWNPAWGGGEDGFMYSLDTTRPEVLAHLEQLAHTLVDAGFAYLKLDFTFAPSIEGGWHDATLTPAQRVRAGFDAIRRGAGDDTFILGCGVPLANVVGVVDANRIGADVAPLWALDPEPRSSPATWTSFRPPAPPLPRRGPLLHAPSALDERPRLHHAADRRDRARPRRGRAHGRRASPCRGAWSWCPTTWPCSAPRRGPASTR